MAAPSSLVSAVPLYPAEKAASPAKVCVTGATGFIAGPVIERLLRAGHTVHATCRQVPETRHCCHSAEKLSRNPVQSIENMQYYLLGWQDVHNATASCRQQLTRDLRGGRPSLAPCCSRPHMPPQLTCPGVRVKRRGSSIAKALPCCRNNHVLPAPCAGTLRTPRTCHA